MKVSVLHLNVRSWIFPNSLKWCWNILVLILICDMRWGFFPRKQPCWLKPKTAWDSNLDHSMGGLATTLSCVICLVLNLSESWCVRRGANGRELCMVFYRLKLKKKYLCVMLWKVGIQLCREKVILKSDNCSEGLACLKKEQMILIILESFS